MSLSNIPKFAKQALIILIVLVLLFIIAYNIFGHSGKREWLIEIPMITTPLFPSDSLPTDSLDVDLDSLDLEIPIDTIQNQN